MSLPFPNRCHAVHEVAPERGRRPPRDDGTSGAILQRAHSEVW
jgi:hypothetical protein